MKYTKYNFDIYQGSTTKPVFTFYSVDEEDNKTYANLNNCSFIMSLKRSHSNTVEDELTTANNRIVVGSLDSAGKFITTGNSKTSIQVVFPHDVTVNYTAPSYMYDLFKINSDNEYELLISGVINVERSITYGN